MVPESFLKESSLSEASWSGNEVLFVEAWTAH